MTVLYGIPNCDTVAKARRWLDDNQISYQFHDLRKDGLEQTQVSHWLQTLGAEQLINKRSTTWKQLSDSDRQAALSEMAASILLAHPTLIKRPLLAMRDSLHCGFKEVDYQRLFQK